MKRILFFILILPVLFSAQVVVWEDNFDDLDISDWTLVDADGDGNNWSVVQIQDTNGDPVWTPVIRSFSWVSAGALTPDNWIVSPAIDLTNASGFTELKWQVAAIDADWDVENYTVYVATGNTPADFEAATALSSNEATLDGVNVLTDRNLDISSMVGQTVYVAFRHHNVSDQFSMEIDNVKVEAAILSVEDLDSNESFVAISPNPVNDIMKVELSNIFDATNTRVSITDMNGRQVLNRAYSETLDVSKLEAGVYIVNITDGTNQNSQKLIKR